jgi:hypothetical protein
VGADVLELADVGALRLVGGLERPEARDLLAADVEHLRAVRREELVDGRAAAGQVLVPDINQRFGKRSRKICCVLQAGE